MPGQVLNPSKLLLRKLVFDEFPERLPALREM